MLTPRETPHIEGHSEALAIFERALNSARLPHAWLIEGPKGIGKATFAYALARRLLAEDRSTVDDPESALFRSVAHGSHPDLHELFRDAHPRTGKQQREITVDAVRAVSEKMHATGARSERRVLLVDAACELNRNAANALLKLLEEPPRGVILLLVCHRMGGVPRTIVSRCARLRLRPLDPETCAAVVDHLLPGLTKTDAKCLAAIAAGSPGRAVDLHEADFLTAYGRIVALLAGNGRASLARSSLLLDILAEVNAAAGTAMAAELLRLLVRRTALVSAGRPPLPEIAAAEHEVLTPFAAGRSLDHWSTLWDKLGGLAPRVELLNMDARQMLLLAADAVIGGNINSIGSFEPDLA